MKKTSILFAVLAVILSDLMCAVVAYHYCALLWGGKYAGYSAPPGTALLYAVPFGIGILLCAVLSVVWFKKAKS